MSWESKYKFEPIQNIKNICEATDKVETCPIYERTTRYENTDGIKRIIDFVRSWLYYPKMQRYLIKNYGRKLDMSRLKYSLWHCKRGKLVDK